MARGKIQGSDAGEEKDTDGGSGRQRRPMCAGKELADKEGKGI